jgi:alkanesulfonate monooxygenase SsuD/methylene tetrahydromethanopterin reductase-like flavin-dependent oxidoreductase (luciferase family)
VIIGGLGKRRTPELAARYADEFNLPFVSAEVTRAQFARVGEALAAVGRDRDELTWSNALTVCVGKTEAEVRRRADAIGREAAELREKGVAGSPAEAVQRISEFREVGSQRIYLQTMDVDDLDHLELIAAEVAPQV